jgi:ferric-dicitrate binding protein FerR (iron transport regulator)
MSNYDEKIWILITRDLTNEADSIEKNELQQWLDEDMNHQKFYSDIKSIWNKNPGESVDSLFFDYERGLKKLRRKLNEKNSLPRKPRIYERNIARFHAWKMVASIVFIITVSVYLTVSFWGQSSNLTNYSTSNFEQRILKLPDGSVVRLNRNSEIEFKDNFFNGARTVRLEGEAFFNVTENPDQPFIVQIGDAVVKVLGTSFNVKKRNEVLVAVEEGLVSLRHKNQEENHAFNLTAGQVGLYQQGGEQIKIIETDIENYMSWINGYMDFNNVSFGQVIQQLEYIYGQKFELQDSSLSTLRLSVYTERLEMEEVLRSIAKAMDLDFETHGGTIIWKEKEKNR